METRSRFAGALDRLGPSGALALPRPWGTLALLGLGLTLGVGAAAGAAPLRVVATVPDLGSLARAVGGEDVDVTVLVKGPQDPHFLEPRPSFLTALHSADVFVVVGMELEVGWVPPLLRTARNPGILPGSPGYVDASTAIVPLEVPQGTVNRTMGDVHPFGNPHYLTDPINGLRVAALLRDRLSEQRPEAAAAFAERYRLFAGEVAARLVGPEAAAGRDPEELVRAVEEGRLAAVLGATPAGGWLGTVRSAAGRPTVEDHKMWEYFARRFGLEIVDTLEPKPGIAPTTSHLEEVVGTVQQRGVGLILTSPYFDPRHARWVSERTGARVVTLAHQSGALEGTPDYLATVDSNVRALAAALESHGS
jgi:ABC-type Zn uptake system ZnuABC Zn-binding protein ZnuA